MKIKGIPVCLRAFIMHCDFIYKGPLALDKSLIFYIEINNTNAMCNKSMQFKLKNIISSIARRKIEKCFTFFLVLTYEKHLSGSFVEKHNNIPNAKVLQAPDEKSKSKSPILRNPQ